MFGLTIKKSALQNEIDRRATELALLPEDKQQEAIDNIAKLSESEAMINPPRPKTPIGGIVTAVVGVVGLLATFKFESSDNINTMKGTTSIAEKMMFLKK